MTDQKQCTNEQCNKILNSLEEIKKSILSRKEIESKFENLHKIMNDGLKIANENNRILKEHTETLNKR